MLSLGTAKKEPKQKYGPMWLIFYINLANEMLNVALGNLM